MKSISAEKHCSVVSLLNEGHSHHQIQLRTGLGKGTIGRISKEVEGGKENHPGGRPSKLSPCDKQSIICQISSGRLDNAVQATQYINSIIPTPITPQTVRNVLKEAGFRSATKKKVPMLKGSHRERCLQFAQYHRNWIVEDWKCYNMVQTPALCIHDMLDMSISLCTYHVHRSPYVYCFMPTLVLIYDTVIILTSYLPLFIN